MSRAFDRAERKIVRAAMRYHRQALRNGYGTFARLNVNMSKERRALFDACHALEVKGYVR